MESSSGGESAAGGAVAQAERRKPPAPAVSQADGHAAAAAGGSEPAPFRAVGFMLSSLGHAVAATFSARLAPLALEPREFALMRCLATREGASQQAIGEQLGIPPSRMVALVDALEARGLLERRPSPNDRRAHALHQTADGKRLLAKAISVAAGLEAELTSELDPVQRDRLLELLDHVAGALGVPPGVHAAHIHGGS